MYVGPSYRVHNELKDVKVVIMETVHNKLKDVKRVTMETVHKHIKTKFTLN